MGIQSRSMNAVTSQGQAMLLEFWLRHTLHPNTATFMMACRKPSATEVGNPSGDEFL